MKEYTLFLDESGTFSEYNKLPSIVSGYLVNSKFCNEQWAQNVLSRIQKMNYKYSEINIQKFHGMTDYGENMQHFCYDVVTELLNQNSRLVVLKNKSKLKVVNSDLTYLNVFSNGIVCLMQYLSVEAKDDIFLNIVYAQRLNVERAEILREYERIGQDSYTVRIDEHIALAMVNIPQYAKKKYCYKLESGKAEKRPLLMLADAVNYCLRGCYQNYDNDLKSKVDALPTLKFEVGEDVLWEKIKADLLAGNIANAIFQWYCGDKEILCNYKEEYSCFLKRILANLDSINIRLQYDVLSNMIKNCIDTGKSVLAVKVIKSILEEEVFSCAEIGSNTKYIVFDLNFLLLTCAVHLGKTELSKNCIEICDALLADVCISYESLGYYFAYKTRVAEHLKNVFDFEGAISILDHLEFLQKNLIETMSLVGDFYQINNNVISSSLAKIYGSRVGARVLNFRENINQLLLAREDSDRSMSNFCLHSDLNRQYQLRCMLEYKAGNISEAFEWLAKAVGVNVNLGASEVLGAIKNYKGINSYLYMHYSSLMYVALKKDTTLGQGMLKEWKRQAIDEVLGKKYVQKYSKNTATYPYYIVYWNSAKCQTLIGESGKNNFKIAESGALLDKENLTVYFAGLAIMMERYAYTYTKIGIADINKIKEKVLELLEMDLPHKMRELAEKILSYLNEVEQNKSFIEKQREILLTTVALIPIL